MSEGGNKKTGLMWGGSFVVVFIILFGITYMINLNAAQGESEEDFTIPETVALSDLVHQLTLEKPGTVASTQDITVSSQANGRVASIHSREGQTVKGGQPIVSLSDTIASYKLQVDNAKNALNRALLTKEQTELSINQQIESAKNAYDNAQQAFQYANKLSEISIKQAGMTLSNADSQIETLKDQFLAIKTSLLNNMDTLLDASDALLGVTSYYEDLLGAEEYYIGANDLTQKNQAKKALKALYNLRDEIKEIPDVPENAIALADATKKLDVGYSSSLALADAMITLMRNSVSSAGTFPQTKIDGYIQAFQGRQSALTQARSGLTTYISQINAQLSNTGTMAQESAGLAYENAIANTENSLFQTEIALKNAKINYETLLENKNIQLSLLDNAIVSAKIAYESALTQYNKLQVRTPVSGVIGDVLVSEGQEVAVGTPIFKVSGTKKQQVEVYITADEHKYIQDDKPVEIEYQDQVLLGTIDAISTVADRTNLFKVTIQLNEDVALLGDIAKVRFPIKIESNLLLPLDRVKILNDNEGEISVWKGDKLEKITVSIQKVWGNFVEMKEPLAGDLQMVM